MTNPDHGAPRSTRFNFGPGYGTARIVASENVPPHTHVFTFHYAQDGNHAFIRLNFNFGPGYEPSAKFPGAICLKELTFRSSDPRHAQRV